MSQYTYRLNNRTYQLPNEEWKDRFLKNNPNAELISNQPAVIDSVEGEKTYSFFQEDENSDLGYRQYEIPESKVKPFLELNPDVAPVQPKYSYDINPEAFLPEEFNDGIPIGIGKRLAGRFVQQAVPFPVDDTIPEAVTLGEKITDVVGGGLGMMTGFGLFKGIIGGVRTLTDPAMKKAAKAMAKYTKLKDSGKIKQAEKFLSKEKAKNTFINEKGEVLVPSATGILGRGIPNYTKTIVDLASKAPKSAAALNEFISNGLSFGLHGQAKSHLPYWDLTERSKQFVNDNIMGSLFTLAGSPQFLEISKLSQNAISAPMLFGIGFGSDKVMPFSPGGEPQEMTLTDRFTHGFGMLSLYYGAQGFNKIQIRQKQEQTLRSLGMPEDKITEFMKQNKNVADQVLKMTFKTRSSDLQVPYIGKSGSFKDKNVDVLRIDTVKGKVPRVTYQDISSKAIKDMPLKSFLRRYQRAKNFGEGDIFNVESIYNRSQRVWEVTKKDIRGNEVGSKEILGEKTKATERINEIKEKINDNKELHRGAQIQAKSKERTLGASNKDAQYMKEALYPESQGSTTNMGVKELVDYNKILSHSVRASLSERPHLGYLETAKDRKGILGTFDAINRDIILDPVTYLRKIGEKSPTAKELSYKLESFRDIYDLELGAYSTLQKRLEEMGLSKPQMNSLFGEVDPFFKDYVTAPIKDVKTRNDAINLIKNTLAETVDKAVAYGVSVKTVNKAGKSVSEPIWSAIDTNGKIIDVNVQATIGAQGIDGRQQKGVQYLRPGDKVITTEGRTVEIKEIKHNHIVKDYIHRIITNEARDLFGTNIPYQQYIIDKMVRYDMEAVQMNEKFQSLIKKSRNARSETKKKEYLDEATKYSKQAIRERMEKKFNESSGYIDDIGIYGNQYSRIKSEIPPEIGLDINGKPIELDKFNTYKKGDVVNGKTIDRIVQVYETSLPDVLSRYANKMAHILSVTGTYGSASITPEGKVKGSPGIKGQVAQEFINNIARETNSEKISKYVESIMKHQIHGTSIEHESSNLLISGFNKMIGPVSNAALSLPTSGIKNAMLGQGANATVFGARATAKAIKEISTKEGYRRVFEETSSIGAIETGTRLLETQKLVRYNPGLMYITEIVNRMTAVAAGRISAQEALRVYRGEASSLGLGMSKGQAKHLLFKTFDLQNMNQIVKRGYFTEVEMQKIMQRAHRITQGQPTIEYMPTAFQSKFMRPFTLFHRMAYRSTNTLYKNAVVPAGAGNPWPILKWAGAAYATGAVKEYLYYLASGAPERDMFQAMPNQIMNTMLQGELLGIFSNLVDDRSGYLPAVLDYTKKTGDLIGMLLAGASTGLGGDVAKMLSMVDKLEGEPGKPLSPKDRERIKQQAYKNIFKGMSNESINYLEKTIPLFNAIKKQWGQKAKPYKTEAEYVSKLQTIYADATGKRDMKLDKGRTYNAKTEFYSQLQNLFWAGSEAEKRRIYEASVMLLTANTMNDNPGSHTYRSALTQSIATVSQKILSTSPTYSTSHKEKQLGVPLSRSKYQAFLKYLKENSPDDVDRVIKAQKDWDMRKKIWDKTIAPVKSELLKHGFNREYRKQYGVEPTIYYPKSMYEQPEASREMFNE